MFFTLVVVATVKDVVRSVEQARDDRCRNNSTDKCQKCQASSFNTSNRFYYISWNAPFEIR